MKTLFMFPGQGAQQVGMGRTLAHSVPEVADLYRHANGVVGYDLAGLCFAGPEEKLNTTEFSQPAIFVTSAAMLTALRLGKIPGQEGLTNLPPDAAAGLSLGEYTALYAAGALEFDDALRLVQLRGQAMQQAAEQCHGTMVSILGMDEAAAYQLCAEVMSQVSNQAGATEVLAPVNFNCPGQIVISGTAEACHRAVELIEANGSAKAIPLNVGGGFHTQLMAPAAQRLQTALNICTFHPFKYPVLANVDAQAYDGVEGIAAKLLRQLVSAVRWQQLIENLLDQGFEQFVEIGPGRVLTGLVKKICRRRRQNSNLINISDLP